jgi:hypothetical protein
MSSELSGRFPWHGPRNFMGRSSVVYAALNGGDATKCSLY